MSQEQREFVEEQRRQRRLNMSQEERDALRAKDAAQHKERRAARATMSQNNIDTQNVLQRQPDQGDPNSERKREYRAAYMWQWRAKKKAKKLYDAEMARIRSHDEDSVTLTAEEFRPQRETRRKVMADVEGNLSCFPHMLF